MRTDAQLGIAATVLALATCLLAPGVTARPGAQAPDAQAPGGQPTFRTGTRLATFDAVVTDAKGRHVTDLPPADFEKLSPLFADCSANSAKRRKSEVPN